MNQIVLENGYNTDYIYSILIALFASSYKSIDLIVDANCMNPIIFYVQEFIKIKFIYHINDSRCITTEIINKFRLMLYNLGLLKESTDITYPHRIEVLYKFLVNDFFNWHVNVINCDNLDKRQYKYILLNDTHVTEQTENTKIVNISDMLKVWEKNNLDFSFKFDPVPFMLPIYIDVDCNKLVNIMEEIEFDSIKIDQQHVKWTISSLICKDDNYYAIVYDKTSETWTCYSDKYVPSNVLIDMHDVATVRKIMKEVIFIFYLMENMQ